MGRIGHLPHLQDRPLPGEDMASFRAEEDAVLNGYAVTDKANGYARIPVSRAIDILVEKGLPETPAAALPEAHKGAK